MYIGICPKGSFFSSSLKACDYSTNSNCDYPISSQDKTVDKISKKPTIEGHCQGIEDGQYAHPSKCSMFILCLNQKMFIGVCPSGHEFSSMSGMCERSEKVDCNDSHQTSRNQHQWKNIILLRNIYAVVPTLNRFMTTWINQEKSTILSECIYKEDGLYPHPQQCDAFIQCYEWQTFVKKCSNNLHFNLNSKRCDHPDNAMCAVKDRMPLVTLNYNTIVKIPSQQSPDSNNVLNSTPVTVSEKMPVESSPKYPTLEGHL